MGKVGGGCTLECALIQTQDMYQRKGKEKLLTPKLDSLWIPSGRKKIS